MNHGEESLVISSRNCGYIASLSSVFEGWGIVHRFEVHYGLMQIVVPPKWAQVAEDVLRHLDLDDQAEPYQVEHLHLYALDAEELADVINQPDSWSPEEVEAARGIREGKLKDRKKALDLLSKVPIPIGWS